MTSSTPFTELKIKHRRLGAIAIILFILAFLGIFYFSSGVQNTILSASALVALLFAFYLMNNATNREYTKAVNLIEQTEKRLRENGRKTSAQIISIKGLLSPRHGDKIHIYRVQSPSIGEMEIFVRSPYESEDMQTAIGQTVDILSDPQNPQIACMKNPKAYLPATLIQ